MTDLPGWDKQASPYHPGEQQLHARLGRKEHQERMGRRIHRPFMPEQHRSFFSQLPFLIAGSVDRHGWPWASALFGEPGFVATPDDRTVSIETAVSAGDPFGANVDPGAPVSFVGIELPTRRRNRINGVVREHDSGRMLVDVVQSFGNCPQYIHTRELQRRHDPERLAPIQVQRLSTLDDRASRIIARSTSLFVASHNDRDDKRVNGGVDVNHRGGKPGFVKIDGDTLTVPDYIGNFAFNTLGNFVVNPKAGLLFIDLESGDLLQLSGSVELLWEPTDEIKAFRGAERAWRFHLDGGQRLIAASPIRFRGGQASPNTQLTGDWVQAERTLRAEVAGNAWRPFRIVRIERESDSIRSFYLEPADGDGTLVQKPGQHLSVRILPDGAERPAIRTYTLSSAPSDALYRISVKRERAVDGRAEGLVSNYLHSRLEPGDTIDVRAPAGDFWMHTGAARPAVLIAAGVGITPMIAMARQAITDGFSRRHLRPLSVIHAARTTAERAFAADFAALEKAAEGQLRYLSLIGQPAEGERAGRDFHAAGRLNAELLRSVLPQTDADVFLCGPTGFMQAAYELLIDLGVSDARVFAEAFGPASLQRRDDERTEADPFEHTDEALVSFSVSGIEQPWRAGDGTLLELAEAHGLTPNHGCRSGTCGSCATRLASGNVGYITRPSFQPDEGEVLICCAVPARSDRPLVLEL